MAIDFANSGRPHFIREAMGDLKDLDISILVNNVGVDCLDYFHNLAEEQILNLVNLNCMTVSLLTHLFIPLFL